jgi:3,5-dihydroxyphenylacetyl-CoA synthase
MRHAEILMFVNGLGTANPPQRYTKAECWDAFRESDWYRQLDRRAHAIAETVLLHDNGIEARRLALSSLGEVFRIDPDTLHLRFLTHAPALAAEAGAKALDEAGLAATDIGAVVISTCTGYLCPGLSSYVIERLALPRDIQAFDLVGQGCAAALPNWRLAKALLAARDARHVLSICVEVSSAAMYLDNDPGVLISACLFGDGAGAAVLSSASRPGRRSVEFTTACSLVNPDQRNALRFESRQGMLRNVLTRPVAQLAADHARQVLDMALDEAGVVQADIKAWIMHAGGRDVLKALQGRLELEPHELGYSAAMLYEYGNMSSAFVYFVLQAALADRAPPGWWWMSSFGAGFSCHGALLRVA